jgi:DNA-binding response OmpR family regulator
MRQRAIVLVVGDDVLVRGLVATALRSIGYRALEAHGTREGVASSAPDVDLLVVDECASPRTDAEMVRQLRLSQPGLKVVHLTSHRHASFDALSGNTDVFLKKPFALHDLCDVVECWLGGPLPQLITKSATIH